MGYTLAMSDEIRDWLTDLRSADPPAAALVGAALTALISEGAGLGAPLVTPVTTYRRAVTLADTLDDAYQVCLEKLQLVRRRVADAATGAERLRTLAAERFRLGLTRAQVAERMGVTPDRVAAIERAGAGAADVGTLAGYVSALGGRLEIIADFGGERVPLRSDGGPLRGDGGPAGPPPSAEPGTG